MERSSRVGVLLDEARTRLWPLPALAILVALTAGVLLPQLDAAIDSRLRLSFTGYMFGGGASAARAVMGAIATSLVSVTSLTFSLTVVTLQLASSQYSPRLLRTFTRDPMVQVTMALFLGSFVYSLTVLRTIRSPRDNGSLFVPQIALAVAFALALVAVMGLVLFISHLAREIRVETTLKTVHREASRTLDRLLGPTAGARTRTRPPAPPPGAGTVLVAPSSGFLVCVDETRLARAACSERALLRLDRSPGDLLVSGVPIGLAWSTDGEPLDPQRCARLQSCLGEALWTGFERTGRYDLTFGLRQLTDVALKALSPGVNDPTTAVHAIGHATAMICEMTGRPLGPRVVTDGDGADRLVLAGPGLGDLLELAVVQPAHYGAGDVVVAVALLDLLRAVAWHAGDDEQRRAVAEQLVPLRRTLDGLPFTFEQRTSLDERIALVEGALEREDPSGAEDRRPA